MTVVLVAEPCGSVSHVAGVTSGVGSRESVGSVLSSEPGVGGLTVGLGAAVGVAARDARLAEGFRRVGRAYVYPDCCVDAWIEDRDPEDR